MENKDIISYLDMAIDQERSIYETDEIIETLKKDINSLAVEKRINLESLNRYTEEEIRERKTEELKKNQKFSLIRLIVTLAIMWIPLFIVYYPLYPLELKGALPDYFWTLFGAGSWIWIIYVIVFRSRQKKKMLQQAVDEEVAKYMKETAEENAAVQARNQVKLDAEKARIAAENVQKGILKNSLDSTENRQNNSRDVLKKIYSVPIIYPTYQNLAALCSIKEYLESGRCDRLTGGDGAYNKYDLEKQLNLINDKLDEVNRNLSAIRNYQPLLYLEMCRSNELLSSIQEDIKSGFERTNTLLESINETEKQNYQELVNIAESSKLTAYNTKRIETETVYLNRMKYYSGEFDNVDAINSVPPMAS